VGEAEGKQKMSYARYKNRLESLNPVAIKLGQSDICAPQHDTWGVLTCDTCGDKFVLGPNRIYGSRTDEQMCVQELESMLTRDHKLKLPHQNSYDLQG
jgi:hypothetical protein